MTSVAAAVAILPGKTPDAEELARGLREHEEIDAVMDKLGISRETWWIQETPRGDLLVMMFEADDPEQAMRNFASATGELETWERRKLLEVTGVDFSREATSFPRLVWDYRR